MSHFRSTLTSAVQNVGGNWDFGRTRWAHSNWSGANDYWQGTLFVCNSTLSSCKSDGSIRENSQGYRQQLVVCSGGGISSSQSACQLLKFYWFLFFFGKFGANVLLARIIKGFYERAEGNCTKLWSQSFGMTSNFVLQIWPTASKWPLGLVHLSNLTCYRYNCFVCDFDICIDCKTVLEKRSQLRRARTQRDLQSGMGKVEVSDVVCLKTLCDKVAQIELARKRRLAHRKKVSVGVNTDNTEDGRLLVEEEEEGEEEEDY